MPVYVSANRKKDFLPPPEGRHLSVFVDVVDLGIQPGDWGPKPQVDLRWQTEQLMDTGPAAGKPYLVTRWYTPTLGTNNSGQKSNLLKLLEAWRGSPMTEEEKDNFDLETLLGKNCLLTIEHYRTRLNKLRGRILKIERAPRDSKKLFPRDYVREVAREQQPARKPEIFDDEEEVPF